jgi:hypothetical protein
VVSIGELEAPGWDGANGVEGFVAKLSGNLFDSIAAGYVGEVVCMYGSVAWVCLLLFAIGGFEGACGVGLVAFDVDEWPVWVGVELLIFVFLFFQPV